MVVLEWIQSVGNELLARREPGEPTYIIELFLQRDYTETSAKTAAPWFLTLLTSCDGGFHTLVEETHCLNNLAAVVKVYQYHQLNNKCTRLTTELNRILDTLSSTQDHLNGC
jgi:hypothetical protein